ncbi:hypothetical protein [Paenarthrobacter nitroguajacolicus]|nr:hypothetical protein [Paenarthrobacter nitroguajacolicus]
MHALVLMGVVLVAAVMWVGVIITMLSRLDRAEDRADRKAHNTGTKTDTD